MIVAPLIDPILSLAFGVAVADGRLIRRSAVTVSLGVISVIVASAVISMILGITYI